jgi:hypothetical protein
LEKAASDCGFELTPILKDENTLELKSAAFPELLLVSILGDDKFRLTTSKPALLDGPDAIGSRTVQGFASLYSALQRASATARTLPNRVADKFRALAAKLPATTEAERLVIQRVGQDLFRAALLDYWQGACCVTGLSIPSLLRASHIQPWAKCPTDDARLDVFNGLLLAPHVDALFDAGWISFSDDGALLISVALPDVARTQLGIREDWRIAGLKPGHAPYLALHRQHELRRQEPDQ